MRAQFYYTDDPMVRVFDTKKLDYCQAIMDCHIYLPIDRQHPNTKDATETLIRCGLRRTSPWRHYTSASMWEAQVSFIRHKSKTKTQTNRKPK